MSLRIGDKVKFLNETGEGVVTEFIDNKTAKVKTQDGFDIPALITELVIDNAGTNYHNTRRPTFSEEPKKEKTQSLEAEKSEITEKRDLKQKNGNVLLALVPRNETEIHRSDVELYLVNDTNYYIIYLIGQLDNILVNKIATGTLEPETKIRIKTYNQTEISKIKQLFLQALYFGTGSFISQIPENESFDLDGLQFYKESIYKENDFFNEKALLLGKGITNSKEETVKISGEELRQAMLSKDKKGGEIVKKTDKKELEEVDLHIQKIVDEYEGLSNGEIINIQMSRFTTALEGAILNKTKKIVFIHGVGNGKLKYELRKALETKYPDYKYQDASFKEYGYGATLINLI
ncbi:MAG: DUF2027 domain-containing protein [Bacteroidales bacterium]|nr:DUF2027 domain-containing protein [Bacteroidales bacterium]